MSWPKLRKPTLYHVPVTRTHHRSTAPISARSRRALFVSRGSDQRDLVLRSGSGRADLIDQGAVRFIVGEAPRTVEHGEAAVRVFVNAHVRLDEVTPVALLGDLQHATRVAYRVVVPHHALRLDA